MKIKGKNDVNLVRAETDSMHHQQVREIGHGEHHPKSIISEGKNPDFRLESRFLEWIILLQSLMK